MKLNPLSILFGGQPETATLIDGTKVDVFVRALPQCHLHYVLRFAEHNHLLIDLLTYTQIDKKAKKPAPVGEPLVPAIENPAGFVCVPAGWNQNLSDESLKELAELAKKLNFQRAVDWAKGQIAAKKMVAPLYEATIAQVMPIVEQAMRPLIERIATLSNSTPSAPSSSDAPAATS